MTQSPVLLHSSPAACCCGNGQAVSCSYSSNFLFASVLNLYDLAEISDFIMIRWFISARCLYNVGWSKWRQSSEHVGKLPISKRRNPARLCRGNCEKFFLDLLLSSSEIFLLRSSKNDGTTWLTSSMLTCTAIVVVHRLKVTLSFLLTFKV